MTKEDIVIIWLSLQIVVMSFLYTAAIKQASYLQGTLDTYQSFAKDGPDGTCYAKKGDC